MGLFSHLFGKPASAPVSGRKDSAAGHAISNLNSGRAVWPDRDYAKLAREGYRQAPIAYRCVSMIAEAVSALPVLAYQGKREVPGHPALGLITGQANPGQSGCELLLSAVSFFRISGNAYLEAVTAGGEVIEIYALRPDRMRVIPGPRGFLARYEYTAGGEVVRFDIQPRRPSPILHIREFHPLDDWYGMSPLDPAGWSIDKTSSASSYIATMLDRMGEVPSAFRNTDKDNPLSPEQIETAQAMFARRLQEARKIGKPLVLDQWDHIAIGAGPKEMGAQEAADQAARETALVFGVPPMLLGIPGDNTYSNYQEANRAFYRLTVLPLASRVLRSIGTWLGAHTGTPDLRLVPDIDGLPALAEERAAYWTQLGAADFLTADEKREAVGYDKTPGGDVVLVQGSMMPLTDAGKPVTGGPQPGDGEDAV